MIKTSPLAPLGSARGTEMGGALRAGGAEAGEAHLHVPSTSFLQKQAGSFGRRAEIMLCNW